MTRDHLVGAHSSPQIRSLHPVRGDDAALAKIAAGQYGLATFRQLRACGFAATTIAKRHRDGRLHRVHQGVYAIGCPPTSREAHWLAAVLTAGDGAVLSHVAAAVLWGIWRRTPRRIDVVIPHEHRRRSGIRTHRSRTLADGDITHLRAIPVTSVARTLLDLGDVVGPYRLANVMHEAAWRECLNLLEVRDVIRRNRGRRSVKVLKRALQLHITGSAGTRSALEDHVLAQLRLSGIDEPLVNTHLAVDGGTVEVDMFWPRSGLCLEVDGPGHRRPRTRREDAERDRRLQRAGYRVVRLTAGDIQSMDARRLLKLVTREGGCAE